MSRNKDYQHLLNDKRWRELRRWKLQNFPLCERCKAEGFVVAAVDCHHIIPVESAKTPEEMKRLCYDPNNLLAVCIPCHVQIHKEMRSKTKEGHKETAKAQLERWIEANKPRVPPPPS